MKSYEYSTIPAIGDKPYPAAGETKWVVTEKFFDQFAYVLDKVPPLPGEEEMYAQYRHLVEAGKRTLKSVNGWMKPRQRLIKTSLPIFSDGKQRRAGRQRLESFEK